MITVTNIASNKIQSNLQKRGKGIGIKVGVRTTGCSGLAYTLEYVDDVSPEDVIQDNTEYKIVSDPKSLAYLNGMTIDYVRNGLNEGFEFVNPNEKDRCGCGESFRV